MASYKLTYFNGKGRAETSRILFAYGDVKYDDVRLESEEWKAKKDDMNTHFGQLPILEVDGIMLSQSHTIERFIAKKLGLYGKDDLEQAKSDMIMDASDDIFVAFIKVFEAKDEDKPEIKKKYEEEQLPKFLSNLEKLVNSDGFLVCDKIMLGDISMFTLLTNLPGFGVDEKVISEQLDKNPKLKAWKEKVASHPNIAKWLEIRPKTQF